MTLTLPYVFSRKFIFSLSFLLIAALLVTYIIQLSSMTNLAYQIAEQETALSQSWDSYQNLEVSSVQTTSFEQLKELATELNFEKIEQVSYIYSRTSVVANQ